MLNENHINKIAERLASVCRFTHGAAASFCFHSGRIQHAERNVLESGNFITREASSAQMVVVGAALLIAMFDQQSSHHAPQTLPAKSTSPGGRREALGSALCGCCCLMELNVGAPMMC